MSRRAPLVGITCETIGRRGDYSRYDLVCDHRYAEAVKDAGGHPVLLPIARRPSVVRRYLEGIDALVIVGGDDVDPRLYGERPGRRTRVIYPARTRFETRLYRAGRGRRLPILAICHGMQLVNVLEGGDLVQDLPASIRGRRVGHRGRGSGRHGIRVLPGTRLARVLRAGRAEVPTEHHQAVRRLAKGFVPAAVAPDGIVEAFEHPKVPELFAVQWHPERALRSELTRRLFAAFVRRARDYADARGAGS